MRSKADETFVIVETLICPLQNSHIIRIVLLYLVAYLSSYHEKAINALYQLA